jgi:hypothetical protein
MKNEQQIPVASKDTLDIIKAIRSLDLLQKQDIIDTLVDLKSKSGDTSFVPSDS